VKHWRWIRVLVVLAGMGAGWFFYDMKHCGINTPCGKLLTVDEVSQLTGVSARSPSVKKYARSCSAIYHDGSGAELLAVEIEKDGPSPSHENFSSRQTHYRASYTVEALTGFDAEAYTAQVPAFAALLLQRPARGVDGSIEIHVHQDRTKGPFTTKDFAKVVPLVAPRLPLADAWLTEMNARSE
jgi:hypothetical protein